MSDQLLSREVVKLSGLSFDQLERWTKRGWVSPLIAGRGQGSLRVWGPEVVAQIEKLRAAITDCPYVHDTPIGDTG